MDKSNLEETADLIRLLMKLRCHGIGSAQVLSAFERIPRALFVAGSYASEVYSDLPIPTGDNEVQTQPSLSAFVIEALSVGSGDKVLEIGTGSGYQAALLSQLARRVFTIERKGALLSQARDRFEALKLRNIVSLFADGSKGWRVHAPFDRIVVNAAVLDVPEPLVEQLARGGRLVVPRYVSAEEQQLVLIERTATGFEETNCLPVHYTPLRKGLA